MSHLFQTRRATLAVAIAVALSACGGGGGGGGASSAPPVATTPPPVVTNPPPVVTDPPPAPASVTLAGVAVDGYLAGATVFLDLNRNGVLDAAEPSTATDAKGAFHLNTNAAAGALVGAHLSVFQGTDTSTGAPFTHSMTALVADPHQALHPITPLTTLAAAMVDSGAASSLAEANARIAQVFGLSSAADLGADPLTRVPGSPTLLQKMVALQQAMQMLASADQAATETTPGPAMARTAAAFGAVVVQAAMQAGQPAALPSIGSLVNTVVATQGKAFRNPAAVQASAQLAAGVANLTEATVAASVNQLLQTSPGASGNVLATGIAKMVDTRLAAIAQLQADALAVAKKNGLGAPAGNVPPVTLASLASSGGMSAALQELVAATERLASIPGASAGRNAALEALFKVIERLTAGTPPSTPTPPGGPVELTGGTISAPVTLDAAAGSGKFRVDVKTAHFVRITNFGAGDSIAITGGGANPLVVANTGADVVLTANIGGTVTQITLVGITSPSAIVGSLAAFNALGAGQVTYE